jgi:AraC-like DNA-binding protein
LRPDSRLADVAIACGYYDQPHMTRDFSRLAETSPAAWQQCGGQLTPLFVGREREPAVAQAFRLR